MVEQSVPPFFLELGFSSRSTGGTAVHPSMDQQQQHEQPPPPPQQYNDGSSPMMMMMMMDQQQQQQQPQQYSASQAEPTTIEEEEGEYEQYEDDEDYEFEEEEDLMGEEELEYYIRYRQHEEYGEDCEFQHEYGQYEEYGEDCESREYDAEEEAKKVEEQVKKAEESKRAKRGKKNEAIEAKVVEEEEVGSLWIGDLQNWMDEEEKEEVRKLWIGDLQHWMDEDYIHRCFAHTGEVFTSKVIRNKKTNECYGFILFKSHAIAESFLHKFNGTPMPKVVGINFSLNWASSRQEEEEEVVDMLEQATVFASVKVDGTTTTTIPKETVNQGGSNSSWEIMLNCWRWAQADETSTPQTLEAARRVYEIVTGFDMCPLTCYEESSVANLGKSLDELQGYVEIIDVAKELHSFGGLDDIFSYMYFDNAVIRAKVAKLIGTMEHNNHSSQQLEMKAGGLGHLFCNLYSECDATALTCTIDAISLLFRKNRPTEKGWCTNLDLGLLSVSFEYQRRILNLIRRLVQDHSLDCSRVTELGLHRLMMNLTTSSKVDAEVQRTALGCLLVLVEVEGGGNSDQKVKNDEQLKQVLQELIERISAMSPEDLGAARVERQLVDSLWKACYNEPSSLEEKGLLVLPGE